MFSVVCRSKGRVPVHGPAPPKHCPSPLYRALASTLSVQCVGPWSHPPDIFKVVNLDLTPSNMFKLFHYFTHTVTNRAVDIRLKCLLVTDGKVGCQEVCVILFTGGGRPPHWGRPPSQTQTSSCPPGKNMRPDRKWHHIPPVLTSGGSHCSGWYTSYWSSFLLPSATKLQQGNVFTPVCQSFCSQGVSASVHAGKHPPGRYTPLGWYTLPRAGTPPTTVTAADGTHPTEVHSCWKYVLDEAGKGYLKKAAKI